LGVNAIDLAVELRRGFLSVLFHLAELRSEFLSVLFRLLCYPAGYGVGVTGRCARRFRQAVAGFLASLSKLVLKRGESFPHFGIGIG
jgi:hypothetical protein